MRIALSDDPHDFARPEWPGLVDLDPDATFFHQPRYLKLYWEEFGSGADLLLAFGEEDGRTVGACAFERIGEDLRFLGGTEVTDYAGPVAAEASAARFAAALIRELLRSSSWATASWQGVPTDSAWLARLESAAREAGLEVTIAPDDVAPTLPPLSSHEEYLASLPAKLRHEIRRKARRLEAEAGPRRLVFADRGTLGDDLDTFMGWHKSSEGPKRWFMEPGMEIFFRRLGDAFLERGAFTLAFVEAGGRKLAGAIGFGFKGRFHLYNSAFDPETRALAPGMVLVADLIEWAIGRGCSTFDMLKGDLEYKYRFGARARAIQSLVLRRRGGLGEIQAPAAERG